MITFRLSREIYARDLSGKGAQLVGGRWNSRGKPVIYTSGSRALCTSEVAVHLPLGVLPDDYMLINIFIPDDAPMEVVGVEDLEENWRDFPHPNTTQKVGDSILQENKHLVIRVPSAVVPGDFNFLINPLHPQINTIKIVQIEPFRFDGRLFIR